MAMRFLGSRTTLAFWLGASALFAACSVVAKHDYSFVDDPAAGADSGTGGMGGGSGSGGMAGGAQSSSEAGGSPTDGSGISTGGAGTGTAGALDAGGAAGDGTVVENCGSAAVCVGAPPGWSGPVVLVTEDGATAPPPCPGNAAVTDFLGYSGLTAAAPECGCACDPVPAGAMSCGPVTMGTVPNSCAHDTVDTPYATTNVGSCADFDTNLPEMSFNYWKVSESELIVTQGCTERPTRNIPAIDWDAAHRACELPVRCAEGACVPALGSSERLCVYTNDSASCPVEFPDRVTVASGADDTRDCTSCDCGDVEGSCTGTVSIWNGFCGAFGETLLEMETEGCMNARPLGATSDYSLHTNIILEGGTCSASDSVSSGSATPEGEHTVCCRE
jgi:hypothetical protein